MKYFLGTYEPKLLPNGQIALPAKIRRVLSGDEFIFSMGFDKCVFGFSVDGWDKIVQPGLDKPVYESEGRNLRRQIFSTAEEVNLDTQGRCSVPQVLRDYAGLDEEIVVIGAGDHFEIWDKGEWKKVLPNFK